MLVPPVDVPKTALQSTGLLSKEGSLEDALVIKAKVALQKAHGAMAMKVRASSSSSAVLWAAIVWLQKLTQLLLRNNNCWKRLTKS